MKGMETIQESRRVSTGCLSKDDERGRKARDRTNGYRRICWKVLITKCHAWASVEKSHWESFPLGLYSLRDLCGPSSASTRKMKAWEDFSQRQRPRAGALAMGRRGSSPQNAVPHRTKMRALLWQGGRTEDADLYSWGGTQHSHLLDILR